jgi:nucleoside-diphosphate kinase
MIQKTLVIIKPDGVQRSIAGEILSRFEKTGLKILSMKMIHPNKELAETHYADVKERHSQEIFETSVKYLTEGPVIAMCLEGVNAVEVVRKLVGNTYPHEALPGTIRGDYAHISKVYANENKIKVGNLIHASANPEEAEAELDLWFKKEDFCEYKNLNEKHVR